MFFRKGFFCFFFGVFLKWGLFWVFFVCVSGLFSPFFLNRVVVGLHNLCFLLCSLWALSCLGAGRGAVFFLGGLQGETWEAQARTEREGQGERQRRKESERERGESERRERKREREEEGERERDREGEGERERETQRVFECFD